MLAFLPQNLSHIMCIMYMERMYVYVCVYGTPSFTMHKPQCIIAIFHRLIWFVSFSFCCRCRSRCRRRTQSHRCYFRSVDKPNSLIFHIYRADSVGESISEDENLFAFRPEFIWEQQQPLAIHKLTRLINGKYFSRRFPSLLHGHFHFLIAIFSVSG